MNLLPKSKRAFVLSGGGALGMLQVGALQALLEADIRPDMWVGTSIGAVNATFLAIHGFSSAGLEKLVAAWKDAARADMLPSSYLWLTARMLFNRAGIKPYHHRMREFFEAHGIHPDLRFGDLKNIELRLVSTDLTHFQPMVYGSNPHHSVLEGVLASAAIPPWVRPLEIDGKMLTDGGAVSNTPIEPAMNHGATEIIALQLEAFRHWSGEKTGFGPFFNRLVQTIFTREAALERELAQARNVSLYLIDLVTDDPYPIWDFANALPLKDIGYQIARKEIDGWHLSPRKKRWYSSLSNLFGKQ